MDAAAYDEMMDASGGIRAPWRGLARAFLALGEEGLRDRAHDLDRALEEAGAASVLPGVAARAWRCDPLPLLLPAAEFARLEAGLAQRARLLEAVLADIDGERVSLAEGWLPPALAFANPGLLRVAPLPAARRLFVYAADLVRDADGGWRVLRDFTDAPSGLGRARENRRALSRVVPEALRVVPLRPLRPFFDRWQEALRAAAPGSAANPAVAVLTPGTASPEWFEHLYLARELSAVLVEGGDLTVSGGALFLKTLRGLAPIDVVLRRVAGAALDPLEVATRLGLGVPGLFDAARALRVTIANAPGAGLVEAPALAAFLPALALRLLGVRLLLPGVPTLWLGEDRARARIADEPGDWLLRAAMDQAVPARALGSLAEAERAAALADVARAPWAWAATRVVAGSVAPSVTAKGLAPLPVVLRLFLVHAEGRWQAMPGGLARIVEPVEALAGPNSAPIVAKDVWVLAEDGGDILGASPARAGRLAIRRPSGDLPSRAADDLFWLGRMVERLEHTARLGRAVLARLGRGAQVLPREAVELGLLRHCLVEAGIVPEEHANAAMLGDALLAAARPGGAFSAQFADVSRLIASVRDRLTGEMYTAFTQALAAAQAEAQAVRRRPDKLSYAFTAVLRLAAVVAGLAAENMVRGGGWLFLELGKRVERAHAVAVEIGFALDLPPPRIEAGLRLALDLCDSAITYRARYIEGLQPAPVLDLVLADQGNPRGFAFQCVSMHALLDELEGAERGPEAMAASVAGLLARAEAVVGRVAAAPDEAVAAAAAAPELAALAGEVASLSERITRRYFALLPMRRSIGASSGGR